MDGRPMDGIRVLDAATFIAGPHAATILGALGLSPDDIAALARKGVVWARGEALALRLASPGGVELMVDLPEKRSYTPCP